MRGPLLILSLLLTLMSCSQGKSSKASLNFELSNMAFTAGSGGAVVFGWGDKGKFARVLSGTSIQEELPKGQWSFGIISWDGAGGKNFTGETICGFKSALIDGDQVTINISVNNTNCFDPSYTATGAAQQSSPNLFKKMKVQFCDSDVSGTQFGYICNYAPDTIYPHKRSYVGSYRIRFDGGRSFGATVNESFQSDCYSASNNDEPGPGTTYNSFELNIPHFLSTVDVPLKVVAYLGPNCETTMGDVPLKITGAKVNVADQTTIPPLDDKDIFVQVPVNDLCAISNAKNLPTGLASGEGVNNFPYLICNEQQLKFVTEQMGLSNYSYAHYVLGADLDLSKYVGAGPTPYNSTCTVDGDTFNPIGKVFNGACSPLHYPFNGKFDGKGHKISNFRYKNKNDNNVGFIAELASGAVLADLILDRVEIEAATMVGGAVGQTGSTSTITNVRVRNSKIEAQSTIGGIVGSGGSSALNKLFVSNTRISGNDTIGGVAGTGNTISQASFSGVIDVYMNASPVQLIGGIVGYGNTINEAVSTGVISGSGIKMGGIAGQATTLNYSRSDMVIWDKGTTPPRNLGGLIGYGSGGINRSFFYGSVSSSCVSACVIGGLSGGSHTLTKTYSSFMASSGGGVDPAAVTPLTDFWNSVILNDGTSEGLCFGDTPTCWSQIAGDLPRRTFEVSEPCADTNANLPFASQPRDGSQALPYMLCNPAQMNSINSKLSSHFELLQNINVNGMTSIGTFSGVIHGKKNLLHSFQNLSVGGDLALITDNQGTVRNLNLAGFHFANPSSCSGCHVGALAKINSGTIDNVDIVASKMDVNDNSAEIGGIVWSNSGTISNSKIQMEIINPYNIGGLTFRNSTTGLIDNVRVLSDIAASDLAGYYIGGVVGLNYGKVSKTSFEGKMDQLDASTYVGGIVAYGYPASTIIDSEFTSRASIIMGTTTDYVGGILGMSEGPTTANLTRNVANGTLFQPGLNSTTFVGGIVGDGPVNASGNLVLSPALKSHEVLGLGVATYVGFTDPYCSIDIQGAITGLSGYGAVSYSNQEIIKGSVTDQGSNKTRIQFLAKDSGQCSGIASTIAGSSTVNLMQATEVVNAINITTLKTTYGYDVADMSAGTDLQRVLTAYFSLLKGEIPKDPPVWTYENAPDEGFRLFDHH